jgi:metallopeptidase family M12-like protein
MLAGAVMVRESTFPAIAIAIVLVGVGASPAPAQPPGGDTKDAGSTTEQVIISNMPQKRDPLLESLLGKAKNEKLSHTQSEVWTVPGTLVNRLRQRLELLGAKITHLREDWNHILKRDNAPTSPAHQEILARAKQSPETVAVGVMRAPETAVAEYALIGGPDDGKSRIVIPISDNQQITVARTKAARTEKGVIWRGIVEDTGESAVLQWRKDGRLTGEFVHKGHIYIVMNMGGDLHAVLEVDPKMMPPDHPPTFENARQGDGQVQPRSEPQPPSVEPISPAVLKELEAKTIVIDVMMLYTKRAASHYMRDPEDMLELAIQRANETFRNSGLGNISLRLVHTQAVDYDEQGSGQFIDLYRMVDGAGPFKDVRRLRDEKHADVVGLLVDDPRGCGLSTRVAPDSEEAYFVVHYACAAITISIAHEMGHILGARHDRRIDPSNMPFPYGHGYVNGTKWRDIMSYQESCDGCPRIPFWSNPRVFYKGEPTGTLTEDNARVIVEQAERVSNFRSP